MVLKDKQLLKKVADLWHWQVHVYYTSPNMAAPNIISNDIELQSSVALLYFSMQPAGTPTMYEVLQTTR